MKILKKGLFLILISIIILSLISCKEEENIPEISQDESKENKDEEEHNNIIKIKSGETEIGPDFDMQEGNYRISCPEGSMEIIIHEGEMPILSETIYSEDSNEDITEIENIKLHTGATIHTKGDYILYFERLD